MHPNDNECSVHQSIDLSMLGEFPAILTVDQPYYGYERVVDCVVDFGGRHLSLKDILAPLAWARLANTLMESLQADRQAEEAIDALDAAECMRDLEGWA